MKNIRLGYSPLGDTVYVYRHGMNPQVALDKLNIMGDFLFVLTDWMLHDMPEGAKTVFMSDGKHFELTLTPISEDEYISKKDRPK